MPSMFDSAVARRQMVDSQLRPNRILEARVVEAMATIPREAFVPERLATLAYIDEDIEVAPGRFLMEPRVFGRLVQELDIQPGDKVLDVGCTTGYSTAVLARLAQQVIALEADAALATRAGQLLSRQGVTNFTTRVGPLPAGVPDLAPYQAIVLEGLVDEVPAKLKEQLAVGGRLAAVVRVAGVGKATIFIRHPAGFGAREIMDAATPPLPGFAKAPGFVF
jgi:protein-L-isoaspartate(D-aspartate) O-methyltransferase